MTAAEEKRLKELALIRQNIAFLFQVLDRAWPNEPKAKWHERLEMLATMGGGMLIIHPETAVNLLLALDALGRDIGR